MIAHHRVHSDNRGAGYIPVPSFPSPYCARVNGLAIAVWIGQCVCHLRDTKAQQMPGLTKLRWGHGSNLDRDDLGAVPRHVERLVTVQSVQNGLASRHCICCGFKPLVIIARVERITNLDGVGVILDVDGGYDDEREHCPVSLIGGHDCPEHTLNIGPMALYVNSKNTSVLRQQNGGRMCKGNQSAGRGWSRSGNSQAN